MNEKPASVEEKIILATIECIEKYGMSGATNRRIAQVAGVNIAAINYYFRSKDVLIQRVMDITLKNAFDLGNIPPMPGALAQERCAAIFLEILKGGLQYPGITRAHFHNLLVEGQPDAVLQGHINRFVDELVKDLLERGATPAMGDLKLALMQIFSGVVLAILTPSLFEQQGILLRDEDASRAYVTRLVDKLLG
jgi:AcrR family transcriptional regulator